MQTGFAILRPDGTIERSAVDWPDDPGYSRIKALIEPLVGGRLEHVSVLYKGQRADMFFNESGAIDGLLENMAATSIYHAARKRRDQDMSDAPWIYGSAVLFDRIVWR
jgi:hypothetical protein